MVAINITNEAYDLLEEVKLQSGANIKFIASKIIIENIARYTKKK